AGLERVRPELRYSCYIVRVDGGYPADSLSLLQCHAGKIKPELVGEVDRPVSAGRPNDAWNEIGQGTVLPLAGAQRFLRLTTLHLLPMLYLACQIGCRGVALGGLLGHRLEANRCQACGHFRPKLPWWRRIPAHCLL